MLMIKKHRKQNIKVEKIKDDYEKYNHQLRKTKNRTKIQKTYMKLVREEL